MTRRYLCILLALTLLLSLLPSMAITTAATEEMHISEDMIRILKKMEGFNRYPVWDYSHYSIGYGSTCPDDMYEYYKEHGITDEEAEELLKQHMEKHENNVNKMAQKYGLTFNQHQFDALVSFTYNCGAAWSRNEDDIFNYAVRHGYTGSDLIYAMMMRCTAGGDFILIRRRFSEANMYLNGVYEAYNDKHDGTFPDSYTYVYMDGNGGAVDYAIHAYDSTDPIEIKTCFTSIPVGVDENGQAFVYEFAGWFTEKVGGTQVEILDGSLPKGTMLYAQWKDPNGEFVQLESGEVIEPLEVTVTSASNIRSGPGTFYSEQGTLEVGSRVTILATQKFKTTPWGRFDGGWIKLSSTDYDEALANREAMENDVWPKTGTVTGDGVRVRTGPGTGFDQVSKMNTGDRVTIYEVQYDGDEYNWGRLEDGNWICMSYVELDPVEGTDPEEPTVTGVELLKAPTRTEYVQMQDPLEFYGSVLRVNYSDGSAKALSLQSSMVSIYSNALLGETTVTMQYEGCIFTYPVTIIMATVTFKNEDGTVLSTGQYPYGEIITPPEVPPKPADEAGEYEFQGWDKEVIPCHGDAVYTAVFALKQEETVPETTAPTEPEGTEPTDGTVPTDATDPEETQPTPTDPLPTDPPVTEPQPTDPQPTDPQPTEPQPTEPQPTEPEWPRTGTVVTDDGSRVNVRDLPSTKGEIRYKLYPGDPVTIYETVYDGTTYWWGRLEDGNWICMDYVKLDEETDPPVTEPTDPTEPPTEPTDPPPTEPVEPEYTPGDVNGDDKVDEDDVIYLLRHLFLPDTYPVRIPADYDRSGTVNEDDVIYLLRSLFMPDKYPLSISKI
ncbi:MAG: hypothetical protein E7436_03990 [Ruminococcaceae bacterium]|nr:hypothetical protein [Oscillospiraceae bacterium]